MMDVILLKKVENLGTLGDKVQVKPGYGRNYLIPTGRAAAATEANLQAFEERRTDLEREAATLFADAEARRAELLDLRITIARRAGDEGRLYGSVGAADIVEAIETAGHIVEKREVRLVKGSLRNTGEYEIMLHLHSGVADVPITLEIVPEV
jgi:large subunit ribosomal protein L9